MSRSILILLGHPDRDSLCGALAQRYATAAENAGHQVRLIALGDLQFDPVLRHGYRQIQPLEADLQDAAEAIEACDHLVLVYPTWWGAMPALLKGFFDRVLLPGYAFRYRRDSVWWDRLLAGRSARVITTLDTRPGTTAGSTATRASPRSAPPSCSSAASARCVSAALALYAAVQRHNAASGWRWRRTWAHAPGRSTPCVDEMVASVPRVAFAN